MKNRLTPLLPGGGTLYPPLWFFGHNFLTVIVTDPKFLDFSYICFSHIFVKKKFCNSFSLGCRGSFFGGCPPNFLQKCMFGIDSNQNDHGEPKFCINFSKKIKFWIFDIFGTPFWEFFENF